METNGNTRINTNPRRNYTKLFVVISFVFVVISVLVFRRAQAATLSVSPSGGTFTVGSTFNVSVSLNTEGQTVNAVALTIGFPPNMLHLISPSNGQSIIGIWTTPPRVNNETGRLELQGGIPGGVNVTSGLVTTLSFRVKAVGSASIRFLDGSKVLLHDGKGTEVLRNTTNGVYQFVLPPPSGPVVASETHPDQSAWHANPNIVLQWTDQDRSEPAEGYSYVLNDVPVDTLDDISEGSKQSVTYTNVADGLHYFHIKALRRGSWGGTTHFAVKIDTLPPAEFPLEIIPGNRTVRRQPIIQFETTDRSSGLSHYELKIIPLQPDNAGGESAEQPLFIEVQSPYVPSPLELGSYDLIVRAYDNAKNYREVAEKLRIVAGIFRFVGDSGLEIRSRLIIPWLWFWIIVVLLLGGLSYLGWRLRAWHRRLDLRRAGGKIPEHVLRQLDELKKYRAKYGSIGLFLFILGSAVMLFAGNPALAQSAPLAPPLVTSLSRNISNEEIFYIGGKTETPNTEVIIYLQNLGTGETVSQTVQSDRQGDWFYRHSTFLVSGNYRLWAQSKIGDELSPPTPQQDMFVQQTALQFGASRISYQTLYLAIIILLLVVLAALVLFILYHAYHGRRKHHLFLREIREAEESVRRGFAILRRDIEEELAVVKKAKLNKALSAEERDREERLLRDLEDIEQRIGKEIWDVEKLEEAS